VTVQDAAGNTVTTDTSAVTLTLTDPGGATLACDSDTAIAIYGMASFHGCAIDKTGTYTLTASDGILTAATSTSVNIVPGVPAAVTAVLGSDQSAVVGREFAGPLVARVTDANDNPVPDVTVAFTAPNTPAGATGTFAGSAHATTALTDADGRATSGVLTANTTSGTYSLTATTGSVGATFTLTNSPGAATTFAITSAPFTGPASATATLGPITVQRQDLYGNPVSAPAGGTEVTIASDSSGTSVFATTLAGTSVTSILIPSGKSSATFYYGDSAPGSPVITTSGLLTSATQKETILAAPIPTTITAAPVGP
jgi:Bacterial Ig-like domain (group 1).